MTRALLCLALCGCATAPTPNADLAGSVYVGPVTVEFTTLEAAHAECERRMGNNRPHWGCATYSARGCDIVVGDASPVEVLGIELRNCARAARAIR